MSSLVCLLGQPAVLVAGRSAPLALRPKALALVAYLALTRRAVPRPELARLLFPEAEAPLSTLRWHLAHIRARAPAFIARRLDARHDRIALSVDTDVARFRAALGRSGHGRAALRALSLYRGDLASGLAVAASAEFDTWLYVEQEGLRRLFRQATLACAEQTLRIGRVRPVLESLARLVSVDPYCEDAHVLLIRAYESLGQKDAARASYDRYQRLVRRELGAEPRSALVRRFEQRPARGRPLPRERLVALSEVTLHLVEWPGADPAILMVHGSAGIAHTLGALAERLSPAHRIVAVDLRGHGFSDKPPAGYDLASHVRDLGQLMTALRLRRPLLLGHSAGGTVVTFLANAVDTRGLVLLEAMIGDRAFTENAAAHAAPLATGLSVSYGGFDEYLNAWRGGRQQYSEEAERLVDRWARFDFARLPDGRYRQRALREAVEAEWQSIIGADSLAALGRVTVPVLVVWAVRPWLGGRPYFTRPIVNAQLKATRAGQLFVAHRSDHATLVRDPEPAMIDAILAFARTAGASTQSVLGGRAS